MTNNCWNTPTLESAGNGKILIGSGSGRPAAANITGDSNVTITNGTNSIEVSSSASGGAMTKISTGTASSSASVDFTGLTSDYFMYILTYNNVQPATDGTDLGLRMSTDNGSSYDSGASDYGWSYYQLNSTGVDSGQRDSAESFALLAGVPGSGSEMSNASNETGSGIVYIINPLATSWTHIVSEGNYINEDSFNYTSASGSTRYTTSAVNAFQVIMSSGNIATGTFVLYGVSAS